MYDLLAKHGVEETEAIRYTYDYPKLFSVQLEKRMDETFHLFKLYNNIEHDQVMNMFKQFPYLFCCDMIKLRKFTGEFKKYKMTEAQIINLVSRYSADIRLGGKKWWTVGHLGFKLPGDV